MIAVDYRPTYAVADSMCARAWPHTVGLQFLLDPNHIAAVGTGASGQVAALMGSADLGWQPTYEGGLVRIDTPAPYPIHGLDRCPYTMPEAPMIEAVATYNATLGTPVALVDTSYQTASLPTVGTTRAQMVAAYSEFAFSPPDEWRTVVTGTQPAVVTAAADDQDADENLRQIAPPGIAASHTITAPAHTVDLWTVTPPEVAAMLQSDQPIHEPNPDWVADTAVVLPAFWLDGDEPPHLLLVSSESDAMLHVDNAVYTELLRDEGVPVRLTELAGCPTEACAAPAVLDSLDLFLEEVLYSS